MFFAALLFVLAGQAEMPARECESMVARQIEARGVRNPAVLAAFRSLRRDLFVPPAMRDRACSDTPLPIGYGQTISQPYIVALMTELLEPARSDRVLEIGTGSGYQAAILSRLVAELYTIELVPELALEAGKRLRGLGFSNVTVRAGDGYLGWPEKAPFDRIILTAAPPEIPKALIDQLRRGGRLVAPEGERYSQQLVVITKAADGRIQRRSGIPVLFVPMLKRSPPSN